MSAEQVDDIDIECDCPSVAVVFHESGPVEVLYNFDISQKGGVPNLLRELADKIEEHMNDRGGQRLN